MTQHYQSANAVLAAIKERLASARTAKPAEVLDAIVETLAEGRGYRWTGIYLATDGLGVRQSSIGTGPAPASIDVGEVRSEVAVPIRLGARTLGLIVAESGRTGAARQERVLLQQVAKMVAQFFTTDRAKQLLRHTREKAHAEAASRLHKSPQSARPAVRKAAAGERIPR
jgi:putative methionine-R-sulfoxide reductase with GAF domain